ncbi:MAG: hypothetical protein FJW35_02495 [Acidobacteria bacterium]|nr:hypothetical protein [Acidobacteriota bacterium]
MDGLDYWLKRCTRGVTPAVILGSWVNALSFARRMGRRGIPVLMLDSRRLAGGYSRHATFMRLPPLGEDPQSWLDMLDRAGSRSGECILQVMSDEHCLFAARHSVRLQRHFHFVLPDIETVEMILNKRCLYQKAQAAGIPVPETQFPAALEDVRRLATGRSFPCLLKPYVSHASRKRLHPDKLRVAHTASQLVSDYALLATEDSPFMIQEIIPGGDDAIYVYLGFWDEQAREVAGIAVRKLRQYPPLFGDGTLVVTVREDGVTDLARRLLQALRFRGLADVEFKYDARKRRFCLIEANPRATGFIDVAAGAGLDFSWITYRHLTGAKLPASFGYRTGVKYVNEEQDLLTLHGLDARGVFRWMRSLRGARAMIAALDDPYPLIQGIWRAVRSVRRRKDHA